MLKLLAVYSVIAVVTAIEGPFKKAAVDQRYLVSNITAQFIDAYAICKKYGYKLASEKSVSDTDEINAAIIAANQSGINHFLGGYFEHDDELFLSDWIWLETGETFEYSSWYSDPTSTILFCLEKKPLEQYGLKWVPGYCTDKINFICEK